MPVSADPNDTIPFSLETDRAKDEKERPTFLLRFTTLQEYRKAAALVKRAYAASEGDDDEAAVKLLDEAIAVGVAGLVNVKFRGEPVADGAAASSYLSGPECWELANAVLSEPQLKEVDRKAFLSRSTTTPAESAAAATPPASA